MNESPKRTVELYLPNALGCEKVAMDAAASVARQMGFSPDRIEDLKTAVAEACINAIEHGHQWDAEAKVLVLLKVQDAQLEVDVCDQGTEAFPRDVPAPCMEDRLAGEVPTRGWGMFLIENLMDEVEFANVPQGGHEVRMVIHLEKHDTGYRMQDAGCM